MSADARPATGSSRRRRRPTLKASLASIALFGTAGIGATQFRRTPPVVPSFAATAEAAVPAVPAAAPSANAFGKSGEVRVRFALPGEAVEYPLAVRGDPSALSYQWIRLVDSAAVDTPRPLSGAELVVPPSPGFYQLALVRGSERKVVDGLTIGVLMPFTAKLGGTVNGYRIGTYLAERKGGDVERPDGFVQVDEHEANLPITKHLRLGDFLTHDAQNTWPRYAAVNPRVLDKLELVLSQIADWRGGADRVDVALDVHSGFRTPLYNRLVKRSAQDSRHQYGDAADVTIDANGDGRFTATDSRIVARAVEEVERKYPDLVGGMGLYTSTRYRTPYVHIDARGKRVRWQG